MAYTRDQMVKHLEAGRSVGIRVNGKHKQITKIADLPSEAELAKGNPIAESQARANIIRQQGELDAQLALLDGKKAASAEGDPPAAVDENDLNGGEGGNGTDDPNAQK